MDTSCDPVTTNLEYQVLRNKRFTEFFWIYYSNYFTKIEDWVLLCVILFCNKAYSHKKFAPPTSYRKKFFHWSSDRYFADKEIGTGKYGALSQANQWKMYFTDAAMFIFSKVTFK